MRFLLTVFFAFSITFTFYSQQTQEKKLTGEYNPIELVSITQYASYDQAIKMLSAVSELVTGKSIISTISSSSPIGVEIKKMPYMDALNLIVNKMNLTYEEKEGSIVIKNKEEKEEEKLKNDIYADIDAREVRISAVFFEADVQKDRNLGIDWNWLLSKNGINIGSTFRTQTEAPATQAQTQGKPPAFELNSSSEFKTGDFTGNATALFRFFETQNLGEILACPAITVRDKQKGRIQIGSDFSVYQRDFSGNTIQRFYSAGSIIEVTPYVYTKDSIDYILLKLNAEKSAFFPSDLTTEIKKTQATSDVLLLNGEQTAIGGLYTTEQTVVRTGIPFLKDLPWWVFGIRYLTGSDETVNTKKEIIIVIKAELLPTLKERFRMEEKENIIKQQFEKDQKDFGKYNLHSIDKYK